MNLILKSELHADAANNYMYLNQIIDHGFNFQVPIEANDQFNTHVG